MLGDFGFRYGISGRVAPSGPLAVDEGHWAAAALGHAWVFNQQTRVVDLVTGTKGIFVTTPTAANRVKTRWGPGYQLGAQGSSDYIKTLQAAADCPQGSISIVLGFSNYIAPAFNYVNMAVREPQGTYTYGSGNPAWVVEADSSAVYWDNGNTGGEQTRATGPGGGAGVAAFITGRDNLNIVAVTDNGTTAGTNIYINNGLLAQFAGSTTLTFGTSAATTDSIQFGNTWTPDGTLFQKCCFHFAYVFKRGLSRMEVASLSANPYQFLVSENLTVRFPLTAGGDASTSLTGTAGTGAAGTFQEAVSLTLDFALSPALIGALTPQDQETLSGFSATGTAGTLSIGSTNLTGLPGTVTVGAITPQVAKAIPASSAAASALGSIFLGQGVTPPAAVGTAPAGTVSWAVAKSLAASAAAGSLGPLQAQGSVAAYLLGNAAAGGAGVFDLSAGTGVVPTGAAGTGAIGTASGGIAPSVFGVGGTSRAVGLVLSGEIIADGSAQIIADAATGMVGDLILDSQKSAQLSGTAAAATAGVAVAASPGVWVKPRRRAGFWTREY